MDSETKINLSSFEMELLNNPGWILTKNNIMKKAQRLLGEVQQNVYDFAQLHPDLFPAEVIATSPKISRGENYRGLPWLMLDYPRMFDKETIPTGMANIFAIRTLFWWGNFFSTTLHLSGKYKEAYADAIGSSYEKITENNFYYCVNDDPWQHHFEKENYVPVSACSDKEFTKLVKEKRFIKLSCRLDLTEWDKAINLLSGNFTAIAGWFH